MIGEIISVLKEKVQDVAMTENTISDQGYTVEEVLEYFPIILDSKQLAEQLWKDWIKEDPKYVPTYDGRWIELKHIRFVGKEKLLKKMSELIVKDFPYTNTELSLDERKELLLNCWCF